jgi:hypothetical protein
MMSKSAKVSYFAPLALALIVACDTAPGPTAPSPRDAQMAVAGSVHETAITINAATVSVRTAATIEVTLWTDGHPLGGKLMTLFVDGIAYDAKHGHRLGTAEFTVRGLTAGTHALSATFAGTNNFFGSTGSGSITVTP